MASGESTRVSKLLYQGCVNCLLIEGQVDYILFSTLNVDLELNPNEVSDAKYVSKSELEDMFVDPCEYLHSSAAPSY